ncbi:hypothetical protein E4U40_003829 [Claviceps sp. LM458 group G5]|nr:hypothetical protein E4U40_003829 [Claviceps sp. LM458 group G5]
MILLRPAHPLQKFEEISNGDRCAQGMGYDMIVRQKYENFSGLGARSVGVHATLGSQSDQGTVSKGTAGDKKSPNCPCGSKTHQWKPEACRDLYQAVTGEVTVAGRKLNKTKLKTIKDAYNSPKFNSLRTSIDNNGWQVKSKDKTTEVDSPDGIAATTIDPELLKDLEMTTGIYTTIGRSQHPLSKCTLFDNSVAMIFGFS